MNKLADKLIVLVLCTACYVQTMSDFYMIVPVLCAVAASALCSYAERDAAVLPVFLLYCAASVAFPSFLFFMPLLCYDVLQIRFRYAAFAAVVPFAAGFEALSAVPLIFIALFAGLSVLMRWRTASLEKLRGEYFALRDSTKELSMQLENRNKELLEKQDYEVNLATLNERNRIARDIHDSVGHVLSNSILQTGALMATCGDEALRARLGTLKNTLSEGMDSIRRSIHDLHDESVDLYAEVRRLADGFRFCPVALDYGIEEPPERMTKYAFIAIVKESLSNVIRHSDATEVRIAFAEHPAFYQLVVRDNGREKGPAGDGIGLKNIEQRVNALGGILTIGRDGGFTVFASIPKEGAN